MRLKYIFLTICCFGFLFSGCEDDEGRVVYPYSSPQITALTYSITDQAEATDSIFFSLNIDDPETPLSTMEVVLTKDGKELYSQSVRTKGYNTQIKDYGIYVPFDAGLEDGEAKLSITAINVEGSSKEVVKVFTIKRPLILDVIYLHYNEEVVEMVRSTTNPYEYLTESGSYPSTLSGKVSTSPSLTDSDLIWGYSETINEAVIGSASGAEFSFDYSDTEVEQISFNTFGFNLGAIGTTKNLKINNIMLNNVGGYYSASIKFEKGKEVEVAGFENLEGAYNRDFFEYNANTGKLTFLRESGTWNIYYSAKYNYMWVARMDDVAPSAFWLVGHGFTCASQWNEDYNNDGWELDNISRLGYAVKIEENKYQCTIYLNNTHVWDSFEVEIYSDLEWNKDKGILLKDGAFSGDVAGFKVSNSNGFTNDDGFVPGYYRLTFDITAGVGNEKMHIERID